MNQEKDQKSRYNNSYLKYSGMAIQMAAIITLGVFGGKKLDEFFNLKQPIFTLILSLFAVFAAIYVSIKDFLKNKNK